MQTFTVDMNPHLGAGGTPSASEFVHDKWREWQQNFKIGKQPSTTNTASGAYASSRLIFSILKKNPSLISDPVPSQERIESMLNNPGNPLKWISTKFDRASSTVIQKAKIGLDNPVTRGIDKANPFSKGGPFEILTTIVKNWKWVAVAGLGIYFIPGIIKRSRK